MLSNIISFIRGDMEPLTFILYLGSICFVVFCATPLHEYAHALIAVKLGDETPRNSGRLTINPTAHIDPIGAVMIFLFGFGYAKPVPVRMRNFNNPKRDMALVALAGPLSNLIQALILMFVYGACVKISYASSGNLFAYLSLFFYFAAVINTNLAVFNLIPIPPLDGSRLLTALLPSRYYYKLMQYERYIMIGLFILLFTGILSMPLSALSGLIMKLFESLVSLIFFGA